MIHKRINGWKSKSLPTSELIPFERFLGDHVYVTKEGGYGLGFQLEGVDSENLERDQLEDTTLRLSAAKNALPNGCVYLEYLVKRRGFDLSGMAGNSSTHEFGKKAAQERVDHLNKTANFGSIGLHCFLHLDPPAGKNKPKLLPEKQLRTLQKAAKNFQESLRSSVRMRLLNADQIAELFSYILGLEPHLTCKKLGSPNRVYSQLTSSNLNWEAEYLKLGHRYIQMFSMAKRPVGTRPNLFNRLLALDCDMILRSRWGARDTAETRKEVHRQEGFMSSLVHSLPAMILNAKDNREPAKTAASVSHDKQIDTLGGILLEIEEGGRKYGDYSLIGMVHSRNLTEIQETMPTIHGIFSDPSEATILEETDGAMSAYYAMFPGNDKYDVRRAWMQDLHAARMSLIYSPWTGNPHSKSLRGESLAIFETRDVTPFFFDPFVNGLRGVSIAGESGRGKSFLLNYHLLSELKHDPFLYIFDVGKSFESLVIAAGGVMTDIGLGSPRINPFSLEPTEENIGFLFIFIRMLLAKGGVIVAPEDETILARKIRDVYQLPERIRRLGSLVLPRQMQRGLLKWIDGGVYGRTFDNAEDSLQLARVQCFDFQGIGEDQQDLLEPILFWVIRRINSVIHDPKNLRFPKHLVFDELWKSLKNKQLLDLLISGIKTGRKHRYGVTLATQSTEDLGDHAHIIKNACPISILLGETVVNREKYKKLFNLNDEEVDNVISLIPTKESFLKTPQGSKVLRYNPDPMSLALFSTDPDDKEKRNELVAAHGFTKGIETFAGLLATK